MAKISAQWHHGATPAEAAAALISTLEWRYAEVYQRELDAVIRQRAGPFSELVQHPACLTRPHHGLKV